MIDNMHEWSDGFARHDRYHIETVFTYPWEPDGNRRKVYMVETFFFLPDNLDVNPDCYSKEDFYRSMKQYLRLKTPAVLLKAIADDKPDSPLELLSDAAEQVAGTTQGEASEYFHKQIKMFCSIFKSSLRDETSHLIKQLQTLDCSRHIEVYNLQIQAVIGRFRELLIILNTPLVAEHDREMFRHADEFISLTANKYRGKLYEMLSRVEVEKRKNLKQVQLSLKILWQGMRSELEYREQNSYVGVPCMATKNEEVVYRESMLKKVMASILGLKTSRRRNGVWLEHLLLGMAAGIAMAFATLVAIAGQRYFLLDQLSLAFFVLCVAAYIGKDRIKEWLKEYFQHKMRTRIFDYKTQISASWDDEVGYSQESMMFLEAEKLPQDVLDHRNRNFLSGMESSNYGEQVIWYRKTVALNEHKIDLPLPYKNIEGIVDIMRFNVEDFLHRMDNPYRRWLYPNNSGSVVPESAHRVYYVHVVMKYGVEGRPDSCFRCFRLVLDRDGIVRIDEGC